MTDLLVHDATVLTVDDDDRVVDGGTIRVTDGRIDSVAPTTPADRTADADAVVDADGMVAMPGLIDAHRHTDFGLVGGFFSDLDPRDHLAEVLALYHSLEDLDEGFFEAGWRLACLRQLQRGVTTVNAMDFTPEIGADAVGESGLRAVVGPELSDFVSPSSAAEQVERAREFFEAYHGAYGGRVTASIAPGGETGCSRDLWDGVVDLRREYPDLPLHTHLLDTTESGAMARGAGADDPLSLLADRGLLDDRTMLTHFIHADRADARRAADAGASILHCATVYSYYRAGERAWFPLPDLREFGATVALGLDDPFWFDHWDLFREAKHARVLANYEFGAHQWSSYDVVKLLTRDAAEAIGMGGDVGTLAPGAHADFLLLDVDRHRPFSNLPALVANSAVGADVDTVVVDGEVLVSGGDVRSIDTDAVVGAARDWRGRFCELTGWESSLGGSTPPDRSPLRSLSGRAALRTARHAARGYLSSLVR